MTPLIIEMEENSTRLLIETEPISRNTVKISATPSHTMAFLGGCIFNGLHFYKNSSD
jgi:hypothetical protein